jgi:hypothetical protein
MARALLVAIILAIGLGPRIRLPGLLDRAVDLRVQDFLLIAALLYLAGRMTSLRQVWGPWALCFVGSSAVLLTTRLLLDPTLPLVRTFAFYGRAVEMLLLAVVVASLYRLSGTKARRTALRAALITVGANALWVGYQYATGTQRSLLGRVVSAQLEAYGPRLVGEGSAFGTGFFFVFATALGVALYRLPGMSRWMSVTVVTTGVLGAYLSGSRLSLAGAALCLVILVVSPRAGARPNFGATLAAAAATIVVVPRVPDAGRLSPAGVEGGLEDRIGGIWRPLVHVLADHPLTGIGPGQLGTEKYPWTEAHNLLLRAGLDYGVVVGGMFLAIFVTVMLRAGRTAVDVHAPHEHQMWATLAAVLIACAFVGGMVQETLIVVMSTHLIMLGVGLYAGAILGPLPDKPPLTTPGEERAQQTGRHISAQAVAH